MGGPLVYTLYGIDDWASSMVRLTLEAAEAPYQFHRMDKDDLRSPAHLARSPFGLIPAMDTPDGPMFETGAILMWLAERHPGLAPEGPARAAFLSWFVHVTNSLHPAVMDLIHPYRPAGEGNEPHVLVTARARIDRTLTAFEALATTGPDWLTGGQTNILTLYLGVMCRWLHLGPPGAPDHLDLDPYPGVKAALARVETHPAVLRVAAAEGAGPTYFTQPQYHA
jgi:glutathione S-transferase